MKKLVFLLALIGIVQLNYAGNKEISTFNPNFNEIFKTFGINGYIDFMKNPDGFSVTLKGEPSEINDALVNFNETQMNFIRVSDNIFKTEIITKDSGCSTFMLDYSGNASCLDPGCANGNSTLRPQSLAEILALIVKENANYEDAANNTSLEASHTTEPPCNSPYYGYTLGWGFTQEQAQNEEASIRGSVNTRAKIIVYSCSYIGTSTTCGFGSIYCITVSTFHCCAD